MLNERSRTEGIFFILSVIFIVMGLRAIVKKNTKYITAENLSNFCMLLIFIFIFLVAPAGVMLLVEKIWGLPFDNILSILLAEIFMIFLAFKFNNIEEKMKQKNFFSAENMNKIYEKLLNIFLCFVPVVLMILIQGEYLNEEEYDEPIQVLRLTVSISSAALGIKNYKAKYLKFAFAFGALFFIFNPIIPMRLEYHVWGAVNIAAICIFIVFWFYSRRKLIKKRKTIKELKNTNDNKESISDILNGKPKDEDHIPLSSVSYPEAEEDLLKAIEKYNRKHYQHNESE